MSEKNSSSKPSNEQTTAQTGEKSELTLTQEEAAKWKNEYLYLRAEFENYKKHAIKDRSDSLKFGAERIVKDLLNVVDNFERALESKLDTANLDSFKKGIEMTHKELKDSLAKHGVEELPSLGQPFNPQIHEAISSEPTLEYQDGHVSKVFKKPYKLHDKVIRLGQVVVATQPKGEA